MATIEISDTDLANADTFITALLQERIVDADFSEGSALRDFVIKAVALIYAYLGNERQKVKTAQSLLALSQQADSEEVADAVNAILSNLLIPRKTGRPARVRVTLHFSSATTVTLTPNVKFYRTAGLAFVPDIPATTTIAATALTPVYAANNTVLDYVTTVTLVAVDVGESYNISAGKFVRADQFNPFFTYAENTAAAVDGKNVESTAELLARAPTAMSVRNLINGRSIEAVLRENFSLLERVLTVGFGEPEMRRDLVAENVSGLKFHAGGCTDIFTKLPVTQVVETYPLNVPQARRDGIIATLVDADVNFTTLGVDAGDVVRVTAGLPDVPREFIVSEVLDTHDLLVDTRNSFSRDTVAAGTQVTYSIGTLAPTFDNKVATRGTGQTTAAIPLGEATVILQGKPQYRISKVEVFSSTPGSPAYDCSERFYGETPNAGQHTERVLDPAFSGSAKNSLLIAVNAGVPLSTGSWSMRVTYDTVQGYDEIQTFVTDVYQRTLDSNCLAKVYHPLYIKVEFGYRLAYGATTTLDETAAKVALAAYFNTFDLTQTLDVSGVTEFLRAQFPQIGAFMGPLKLTYTLLLPNRETLTYETTDIVTMMPWQMFPNEPTSSAVLTYRDNMQLARLAPNPTDPALSPTEQAAALAAWAARAAEYTDLFNSLGISDRVVTYVATAEDITLTQVD